MHNQTKVLPQRLTLIRPIQLRNNNFQIKQHPLIMKKHFYILLCFIFTTAYVSADNKETKVVEIFGTILDSVTSKPIQSASIKIFFDNIKAKPLFLVSDSKGAFKTRLISDREYLVEISYIGMRPLKFNIKVKRDNLNLGELYLREE